MNVMFRKRDGSSEGHIPPNSIKIMDADSRNVAAFYVKDTNPRELIALDFVNDQVSPAGTAIWNHLHEKWNDFDIIVVKEFDPERVIPLAWSAGTDPYAD